MPSPNIKDWPIYEPKLHVGPHLKDLYCGPAALCAATGAKPEEIQSLVNECRCEPPHTKIRGMRASEIDYVLSWMNIRHAKKLLEMTGENLREYAGRVDKTVPQIVLVTHHYVALFDGFVYDQHYPMGRLPGLHHSRRKWVRVAWVIDNGARS